MGNQDKYPLDEFLGYLNARSGSENLAMRHRSGENSEMEVMTSYVKSFKQGEKWVESESEDFQRVYASWFDHPAPSGVSLAEMGLTRAAILRSEETKSVDYRRPFQSDFYNINALLNNGLFHVFTSGRLIPWDTIPVNSVQLRGDVESDCYMGTCKML